MGAPEDGAEWIHFYEDVFASCMKYLVVEDERIRYLANTLARRIMSEGSVYLRRKSQAVGSRTFKHNFWKSTWVLF